MPTDERRNQTLVHVARDLLSAIQAEMGERLPLPAVDSNQLQEALLILLMRRLLEQIGAEKRDEGPAALSATVDETVDQGLAVEGQSQQSAEEKAAASSKFESNSADSDALPKYTNIDSLLRYVEGDTDGRGIKVVIMNFND